MIPFHSSLYWSCFKMLHQNGPTLIPIKTHDHSYYSGVLSPSHSQTVPACRCLQDCRNQQFHQVNLCTSSIIRPMMLSLPQVLKKVWLLPVMSCILRCCSSSLWSWNMQSPHEVKGMRSLYWRMFKVHEVYPQDSSASYKWKNILIRSIFALYYYEIVKSTPHVLLIRCI